MIEQNDCQKKIYQDTMIKYLTALEEKTRKEKRVWLNEQAIKLGRLSTQRQGSKFAEIWEEGESFRKLQTKHQEIMFEKEEIEKMKKYRNKNKSNTSKKA